MKRIKAESRETSMEVEAVVQVKGRSRIVAAEMERKGGSKEAELAGFGDCWTWGKCSSSQPSHSDFQCHLGKEQFDGRIENIIGGDFTLQITKDSED